MIAVDFDYASPATVRKAGTLLSQPGARVIAGGQSLLTELKAEGARAPSLLVDLRRVAGLDKVKVSRSGAVRVGAMVTLDSFASHPAIRSLSAIGDAIAGIADPQVRNQATFGGSVAIEHQGADVPAAVLALGGSIEIVGPSGSREVDAADFLVTPASARLGSGEFVSAIVLQKSPRGAGSAYDKARDPGSGYAVCGVSAAVTVAGDGTIATARLGLAGAGPLAIRLTAVENAVVGVQPTADRLSEVARRAGQGSIDFPSDLAAPADYRAHLGEILAARALTRAVQRATEGTA